MTYFYIIVGFTSLSLIFVFIRIWINKEDKKLNDEIKKPITPAKEEIKKPIAPVIPLFKPRKPIKFGSNISPKYYGLYLCNRRNYSHKKTNK